MTAITFEQKLAQGKIGEGAIANYLQSRGWDILPAYEVASSNFKGPRLFTLWREIIVPDIIAFKEDRVVWVEAKVKTVFTWHRISKRWTTGIDQRCYYDYLELANRGKQAVWLMFLHTETTPPGTTGKASDDPFPCPVGLFGGEIKTLFNLENHRHENWGKSGMVYWAYQDLKLLASLKEVYEAEQGWLDCRLHCKFK